MSSLTDRMWRRGARLPRRAANFALTEMQLGRLLRPRRIDVCCCGLSKTGTHSLAGIFENYRSKHHPDAKIRLPLSITFINGEQQASSVSEILRVRDRKLWLEMESSTMSGILIRSMMEACPKKKFILTIRDVFSWCDSWLDQNINKPPRPTSMFAALDRARLRAEAFPPTRYDAPLLELGFPSLACFFQLWSAHNSRVLDAVPPGRLFILKTREISARMDELAGWLDIEPAMLRRDRQWLASAPRKHRVLDRIDPVYVQDMAARHCGELMQRFFPDASATRISEPR